MNSDPRFRLGDDGELVPINEVQEDYQEGLPESQNRRTVVDWIDVFSNVFSIIVGIIVAIYVMVIFPYALISPIFETSSVPEAILYNGAFTPICAEINMESDELIVFSASINDDRSSLEIYIFDPVTGRLCRLTENNYADAQPHLSPSGQQIVYVSDTPDGSSQFVVSNLRGEIMFERAIFLGEVTGIGWSPDGLRFAFSHPSNISIGYLETGRLIRGSEQPLDGTTFIGWISNEEILYRQSTSLYRRNLETDESILVSSGFQSFCCVNDLNVTQTMSHIAFSRPGGIHLGTINSDNQVRVYQQIYGDVRYPRWIQNGEHVAFIVTSYPPGISTIRVNGDDRRYVVVLSSDWQIASFDWWSAG